VFVATTRTVSEKTASGLIVRVGWRSPLTVTAATLILAVFVQSVPSPAFKAYALIGQRAFEVVNFP